MSECVRECRADKCVSEGPKTMLKLPYPVWGIGHSERAGRQRRLPRPADDVLAAGSKPVDHNPFCGCVWWGARMCVCVGGCGCGCGCVDVWMYVRGGEVNCKLSSTKSDRAGAPAPAFDAESVQLFSFVMCPGNCRLIFVVVDF